MPFKPTKPPSAPVPARERRRAPAEIKRAEPVLVTVAFNVCVTDPDHLVEITRTVMGGRGVLDADVTHRITNAEGTVDVGECVKALMEESVRALGTAISADVGDIETYLEVIPGIDAAPAGLTSNATGDPI